ncbi:hypothetical protein L873DRAFT_1816128 [Choiromyces venosus 120613-1]|uniref:F-box domain-containing protein n=1 Tax=Choiromyces venosus 120613-1 TaxID=1336337 RepID=A0A3N4JA60_9PEZI|nr:hypothetical protein L873DRAFT_1816128 [Choiromyces venosus 120613-1]
MSLLSLPNELILQISHFQSLPDTNYLLRTNRRLATLLTDTLTTKLFASRSENHGKRALYSAAERVDNARVEYLLHRGIRDFTDRSQLLNDAVLTQSTCVVGVLIDNGVEAENSSVLCMTPLCVPALQRNTEVVKFLLGHKEVGVNTQDCQGGLLSTSPLHVGTRTWRRCFCTSTTQTRT